MNRYEAHAWAIDRVCAADDKKKLALLRAAVEAWATDRTPKDEAEFDLLIALWQVTGDRTEPCPDCDGACGEPCAPVKAKDMIANLEQQKAALHETIDLSPLWG